MLKVERIDHGVRCEEDPALVERLAREQVALTVCPLSNVKLCVVPTLAEHNFKRLLDAGLKLTINSDDPAYFGGYIARNYVETAQGFTVAGWKLPKRWQFNFYDLLDLLCAQQDWVRIKGIFNTDQGWKSFNFNPQQFNYKSAEESIDNRIEIITQVQQDWLAFETQLLACRINMDG